MMWAFVLSVAGWILAALLAIFILWAVYVLYRRYFFVLLSVHSTFKKRFEFWMPLSSLSVFVDARDGYDQADNKKQQD